MKTHTYITIHRQLCMSKDVIPLKTGKPNCRKKKKKKKNQSNNPNPIQESYPVRGVLDGRWRLLVLLHPKHPPHLLLRKPCIRPNQSNPIRLQSNK